MKMKNLIQMYVKFNKSYFTKVVLYFKYFLSFFILTKNMVYLMESIIVNQEKNKRKRNFFLF